MAAISLFSGCGGDTLGLERAGYKVLAFNEFKKAAIDSHLANFPESVLLKDPASSVTDITKVSDEVFKPYAGKVDIVFAGFPCQGFSKAGKKNVMDPRNQMFLQFARVVKVTRPKFFIGENVTGLLSMKSGPNTDSPLMIDLIRKTFAEIGYDMTHQILEAVDFGVPQKRKRVVIVGWDKSRVNLNTASFWAAVSSEGAKLPRVNQTSFITNSMDGAFEIPAASLPEDFTTYAIPVEESATPSGTPHPYVVLKTNSNLLSCSKRVSPIHSEIIDRTKPSKTIICTYDHQPRLLVGLRKPSGASFARCLLPDELKQIQGFPANYKLTGNKKEQVTQIGNAVPPAMIQAVATAIRLS